MKAQRREPHDTGTAFSRALARNCSLLPADNSVAAFGVWWAEKYRETKVYQKDLWIEYCTLQQFVNERAMPEKRFGKALRKAGFHIYQDDEKDMGGKRKRRMKVDLASRKSAMSPMIAKLAEVAVIGGSKKSSVTPAKRAPRPLIPVREAA